MKLLMVIFTILFSFVVSSGQKIYRGFEVRDYGRKGYGWLNSILIDKDSIFIYKLAVRIEKGKTRSLDGGEFACRYLYGVIRKVDTVSFAFLAMYNCENCKRRKVITDTVTGYYYRLPVLDTISISQVGNRLRLDKIYHKLSKPDADFQFPEKIHFYFDPTSMRRIPSNGQ